MSISYMNCMAQKMSPKEYFVINDMGCCDSKGNIATIPHLHTKADAELARETLEEYTGHKHYVMVTKPESATKEFCRDVKGSAPCQTYFTTEQIMKLLKLDWFAAQQWLHSAVYYGYIRMEGGMWEWLYL